MVLALVVLLGMCAMVLDVGSWFRTQRRLQGTADAAALAGAQHASGRLRAPRRRWPSAMRIRTAATCSEQTSPSARCTRRTTSSTSRRRRPTPGFFSSVLGIVNADIDGDGKGSCRAARAGSVRRADGRLLRSPADPELQRQSTCRRSTSADHAWTSTRWARPAPSGCSTSPIATATPGSSTLGKLDPERLRQVPAPRTVRLRPGCQVQLAERAERPRRADRHRSAVPGLQDSRRQGLERGVRDHRLDRLPPRPARRRTATTPRSTAISPSTSPTESSLQEAMDGAPSSSFGVKSIQLIK